MKKEIKQYLAKIGAKGGRASRRKITAEQQAAMKAAREAARLANVQAMPTASNEAPTT